MPPPPPLAHARPAAPRRPDSTPTPARCARTAARAARSGAGRAAARAAQPVWRDHPQAGVAGPPGGARAAAAWDGRHKTRWCRAGFLFPSVHVLDCCAAQAQCNTVLLQVQYRGPSTQVPGHMSVRARKDMRVHSHTTHPPSAAQGGASDSEDEDSPGSGDGGSGGSDDDGSAEEVRASGARPHGSPCAGARARCRGPARAAPAGRAKPLAASAPRPRPVRPSPCYALYTYKKPAPHRTAMAAGTRAAARTPSPTPPTPPRPTRRPPPPAPPARPARRVASRKRRSGRAAGCARGTSNMMTISSMTRSWTFTRAPKRPRRSTAASSSAR